jgi:hypothetical protein
MLCRRKDDPIKFLGCKLIVQWAAEVLCAAAAEKFVFVKLNLVTGKHIAVPSTVLDSSCSKVLGLKI